MFSAFRNTVLAAAAKKLLLAATAISALATAPAHAADLFPPGSTFVALTHNAPAIGTFADLVPLGGSANVGDLETHVTSTIVPVDVNTTWLVFHYTTSTGIGEAFENWAITETHMLASVGVNLSTEYLAFDDHGVNEPMTSSIFGPQYVPAANPVPGGVGDPFASNGLITVGFSTPFPGGSIDDISTVMNPFGLILNTGIDNLFTTGFTVALEFTAMFPVASVPEPASLALLAVGLAGLGMVRRYRRT